MGTALVMTGVVVMVLGLLTCFCWWIISRRSLPTCNSPPATPHLQLPTCTSTSSRGLAIRKLMGYEDVENGGHMTALDLEDGTISDRYPIYPIMEEAWYRV
ncbi:hypothetical protein OROGR_006357 [Orobanche gracilis]